jgi:CRP-like cAMP-binding protein
MKRQGPDPKCKNLLSQYGLSSLDMKQVPCFIFEQGEFLFHEGDAVCNLYFIVSGKAKVYVRASNGKKLLLSYFVSNGVLGSLELMLKMSDYCASVQAVSELVCLGLPLNVYSNALNSNALFMERIGRDLARILYKTTRNAATTILQPLEAKLCAYITQTTSSDVFCEMLTELADFLGTSYRHLLRSLKKLCEDGALRKEPCGYRVVNRQLLNEKAGDLYTLE